MADCFACGTPLSRYDERYRRRVNTGGSFGVYGSGRSSGTSFRTYTGVRTLCRPCAERHDESERRANQVLGVVAIAVLLFVGFVFLRSNRHGSTYSNQRAPVVAPLVAITATAARIRERPSTDSAVVATVSAPQLVRMLSSEGDWYHVECCDPLITGYVHRSLVSSE